MRAALHAEWRKFVTTRMWWILALVLFGYMAFLGAVMAFSLTHNPTALTGGLGDDVALDGRSVASTVYTLAASLGYVFPLVIGALAVTGEFRYETITPTLLAEPRRGVVLVAKLLAGVPMGFVYGVIGTVGAIAGGLPFLMANEGTFLADRAIQDNLVFSVLAMTVWCVIGVGLGSLLTNQIASIVVILAFTQFVEPILRIGFGAVDSLSEVQKFMPGAAAEALAGSSLYSTTGILTLLSRGEGALVLVGYAVAFAVIGRLTTLRRDIS